MVKIATWNVNSVKARLPTSLEWLKRAKPDVVLLQEIKCQPTTASRPGDRASSATTSRSRGQKTYNGVAILSKTPLEDASGAARATRPTSRRATSRPRTGPTQASCASPRSICRTATRSAPRNSPTSSAGWSACTARRARCSPMRRRWCWAATTTSSPSDDDVHHPKDWVKRRAVPARIARGVPQAPQSRLHRRVPRAPPRGRRLQLLGLSARRLAA